MLYDRLITVQLFNTIGEKFFVSFSKNNETVELNISALSRWILFCEIISDRENLVKKFVKRKKNNLWQVESRNFARRKNAA